MNYTILIICVVTTSTVGYFVTLVPLSIIEFTVVEILILTLFYLNTNNIVNEYFLIDIHLTNTNFNKIEYICIYT